jgi:hypothetical protein
VGQEIPFERVDVSPLWIAGINEETLVVDENIGEHHGDKSKEKIRTQQIGAS